SAGWLRLALSRKTRPSPSEAGKMSRGHGEWDILQTREQRSRLFPLFAYPECPSRPSISPLNPSSRPWAPKPSPADDTANCDNETRLRVLRRANLNPARFNSFSHPFVYKVVVFMGRDTSTQVHQTKSIYAMISTLNPYWRIGRRGRGVTNFFGFLRLTRSWIHIASFML